MKSEGGIRKPGGAGSEGDTKCGYITKQANPEQISTRTTTHVEICITESEEMCGRHCNNGLLGE